MGSDIYFYRCNNIEKLKPYFQHYNESKSLEFPESKLAEFTRKFYNKHVADHYNFLGYEDWYSKLASKILHGLLWIESKVDVFSLFSKRINSVRDLLIKFEEVDRFSASLGSDYNYNLLCLIFDRNDNIAYHEYFFQLDVFKFRNRINTFSDPNVMLNLNLEPIWEYRLKELNHIAENLIGDEDHIFCYWSGL